MRRFALSFISAGAVLAGALAGCERENPPYEEPLDEETDLGAEADAYEEPDIAAAPVQNETTQARQRFVDEATQTNMLLIESSQLAEQNASRDNVKQLARTIVADHQRVGERLRNVAQNIPASPPAILDEEHQEMLADIQQTSAENFDAAYLDMLEEAHERFIVLFEDYADQPGPGNLNDFATETLPALRDHLANIRELREGFDLTDDMMGLGSGDDREIEETSPTDESGTR